MKFAFEADYDVKTTLNIGVEFHPGSKITGLNSNGDIYNKVDFQIQIPVALGFFLPIKNNFGLNLESTFNDVQKKHNEYTHAGEVLMGVRYWPSKDVSVHLAMGTGSLENRGGNDPRWVAGLKMPFWLPNAVAESEKKEVINQPVAPMSTEQALTTVSQKILNLKSVEFDLGQSTLTTQGQKILDETYELLKPYENEISTLSITGHTDHYGRVDKNRKLSFDRAQTVRKYLIDKKLNIQEITAVGVGSSKPKYDPSKATKAEIDLNRRVEFDIHKK